MGYICQYCGHTSISASSGLCTYSPHKKHIYIGKHSGSYKCKFCGHSSLSASQGTCAKSPHGRHEYI